jgi:hypothetical protein
LVSRKYSNVSPFDHHGIALQRRAKASQFPWEAAPISQARNITSSDQGLKSLNFDLSIQGTGECRFR